MIACTALPPTLAPAWGQRRPMRRATTTTAEAPQGGGGDFQMITYSCNENLLLQWGSYSALEQLQGQCPE